MKTDYKYGYRKGRSHGRSAKTNVCYNTLFPTFTGGLSPLYFYGTRSELEDQAALLFDNRMPLWANCGSLSGAIVALVADVVHRCV